MMSKWSSKPANHKAVRLRDNQRRYRKKVKDHIAELESRLEETQSQLYQALAHIAGLSEELERANTRHDSILSDDLEIVEEISVPSIGTLELPISHCGFAQPALIQNSQSTTKQRNDELTPKLASLPDKSISSGIASSDLPNIVSSSWKNDTIMRAQEFDYEAFTGVGDRDCCTLPPPQPGMSTTRCKEAYFIIIQQNYKGLDPSIIRAWLKPGFRGEISEGDGCRVDTDVLFNLLDFISSP